MGGEQKDVVMPAPEMSRLLQDLESARSEGEVQALLNDGVLHKMALELAQQRAMSGEMRHLSHGTRLFRVSSGWASRLIAGQPGTTVCKTAAALEAAFRGEAGPVVFIPAGAAIRDEDIAGISRRYGVTKTVFQEEGVL